MHIPLSISAMRALEAIKNSHELLSLVEKTIGVDKSINEHIKQLAASNDGNVINNKGSEIRQLVLSLPSVVMQTDAREFFREIEILDKKLLDLFEDENGFSDFHEIIDSIDQLADCFNKFVKGWPPVVGSELLITARRVDLNLQNFENFLKFLVAKDHNDTPGEGESEFLLILQTTNDLDDFIARLIAISEIYAELAQILKVSLQPMRVAKIESGSLLTILIGDTKVVGLFVDILKGAVDFLYRKYTFEGKVGSISSQVDAFDKILEFNKKLEEAGVNVEESKEQIAKGVHSISQNLTNLLADQSIVSVNENIFSLKNMTNFLSIESDSRRRLTLNRSNRIEPTFNPNVDGLPPPS